MDIKTFKELSDLFQEVDSSWFLYQEQIVNIYGEDDYKVLIDEFEEFINNRDSKDKPKLSLLFYSTLLVIQEDKLNKIADYCKDNESLRYLKIGLNILLKGKYSDIKYEIKMDINNYQNILEGIDFLSGYTGEIGHKLSHIILVFQLIYKIDKESFFECLKKDNQNGIFLYFMISPELEFEYQNLISLLNSKDAIKRNGAFNYLMHKFHYLVYDYNDGDEIDEEISSELIDIAKITESVEIDKRIELIVNYIFLENKFPDFFINEIKNADIDLLLKFIRKQNHNKLSNIIKLEVFINHREDIEIQKIFVDKMLEWVKKWALESTWSRYKKMIKGILDDLENDIRTKFREDIKQLKTNLFISKFDRQVRYSKFLDDNHKKEIIDDILS
ncbi:hypothetical protein SAMN04488598_10763 [Halanaerobium congolense]|uniref:Uncharacterized protein n=1 Tax=Halanaerobium congolense TaxID=54121 RepID=A0A1H9ZU56_9FIRM|nr:hypothetical protein [Halanaerobium congolense]PTX16386.1 hypothetical protein C7953_1103 [Halanaerobium congolense]SDF17428.1 hypothetical protein SAMN04488598_10763 [Halanaerobium congolense]SES84802.1 hypothetical protein SAMN04515652_10863 [Halanaerobium congolense]SFO95151.1 hypothetical protein SAMN04488596_10357 [Halanaerobium congolense]